MLYLVFSGDLRARVRQAAVKQVTTIIRVGVGGDASANMGDVIVTVRAVTLQMPNTVPISCVGKYSSVAM